MICPLPHSAKALSIHVAVFLHKKCFVFFYNNNKTHTTVVYEITSRVNESHGRPDQPGLPGQKVKLNYSLLNMFIVD